MDSNKPVSTPAFLAALALLSYPSQLVTLVDGAKDNDYYPAGRSNPLIKEKMYWKDSINVLDDLSKFKALYVRYHNCAWSTYGSRYGIGDEEESGSGDGDWVNGCVGGGYGGEKYWYLGRTQCFRANAAFSLYGVLLDDDDTEAGNDGTYCHKGTYINSFFSTHGVESFAGPLGISTCNVNSYCTTNEPNDDAFMYDYDAADEEDSGDFVPYDYKAWTSYGAGCLDGRFVQDKYQGAFCHGSNFITTMDTLDTYNSNIESAQCTQIYNYGSGQYAYGQNDDDEGQNDGDEDNGNDFSNKNSLAVLTYSKACSLQQYPHDCPDPYGKKKHYAQKTNQYLVATGIVKSVSAAEMSIWATSAVAFAVGAFLLLSAFVKMRQSGVSKKNSLFIPAQKDGFFDDPQRPLSKRIQSAPARPIGSRLSALVRNSRRVSDEEEAGDYAKTDDSGIPCTPSCSSSESEGSTKAVDFGRNASTMTASSAPSVCASPSNMTNKSNKSTSSRLSMAASVLRKTMSRSSSTATGGSRSDGLLDKQDNEKDGSSSNDVPLNVAVDHAPSTVTTASGVPRSQSLISRQASNGSDTPGDPSKVGRAPSSATAPPFLTVEEQISLQQSGTNASDQASTSEASSETAPPFLTVEEQVSLQQSGTNASEQASTSEASKGSNPDAPVGMDARVGSGVSAASAPPITQDPSVEILLDDDGHSPFAKTGGTNEGAFEASTSEASKERSNLDAPVGMDARVGRSGVSAASAPPIPQDPSVEIFLDHGISPFAKAGGANEGAPFEDNEATLSFANPTNGKKAKKRKGGMHKLSKMFFGA